MTQSSLDSRPGVERPPTSRTLVTAGSLLAAAVVGLAVGVVTLSLQGVLPGGANVLANSGVVWTVVAFAVALVVAGPRWLAVLAALLTLLAEVAGYYAIAAGLHGIATTRHEQVVWTVAAVCIGPFAGLAAHALRRGAPGHRLLALFALGGLFCGEAVHELWRLGRSGVGWAELLIGVAIALVGFAVTPARWPWQLAAVGVGVLVAGLIYLAYGGVALA